MKKLKAIIPEGGAPLGQFPVLREIFDTESKNAIEAMLSSVIIGQTQGVILSGCLATGIAGNFAISAGYIFVDGEVLEYLGSTGNSTTVYLKKGTVTEDSGVFADGATKAYIDVNQATAYTTTGGGSGTQYITLVFAIAGQTLADRMGDFVNDNTVTTSKLVNASVTLAKMASDSVDSAQYVDGSIDLIHMSANSVDSDQYVDGSIDDVHLANDKINSVGVQLFTKILEIGDWDMDSFLASSFISTGGVAFTKLRSVTAIIRNDADTSYSTIHGSNHGNVSVTASGIQLDRVASGVFDTTDYDSTTYNRGWVTIIYEL